MLNLGKNIISISKKYGSTFIGFSYVKPHLPDYLKAYPYAITIGIRLLNAIVDEINNEPTFTYFNHYRSLNFLIDQIGLQISIYLQDSGYKAYTIAASQSIPTAKTPYSGIFPHKTGAVLSGMGWIGKNNLFIHSDFGPRVRLGTILTNLELSSKSNILKSQCSDCSLCKDICPAGAIKGNLWTPGIERSKLVDPKLCSEFMNQNYKKIGRGSVCGLCMKICPHYKDN